MASYDAESPPNRVLPIDSERREPPRRAYARVDSVERVGIERGEVLAHLDAIDASWFEEHPTEEPLGRPRGACPRPYSVGQPTTLKLWLGTFSNQGAGSR
jgi:hypothetical protein